MDVAVALGQTFGSSGKGGIYELCAPKSVISGNYPENSRVSGALWTRTSPLKKNDWSYQSKKKQKTRWSLLKIIIIIKRMCTEWGTHSLTRYIKARGKGLVGNQKQNTPSRNDRRRQKWTAPGTPVPMAMFRRLYLLSAHYAWNLFASSPISTRGFVFTFILFASYIFCSWFAWALIRKLDKCAWH